MPAKLKVEEYIGKPYNDLTILREDSPIDTLTRVSAICICGETKSYFLRKIISGQVKNCGCKRKKNLINRITTHGLTQSKLYIVWNCMKKRCYDVNHRSYLYYGGRGVRVCDEWRFDFKKFYNWCIENGWEAGLQLDKDTKGDGLLYSPDNCVFLTHKINQNNKRNSVKYLINEELLTLPQIADKYDVKLTSLTHRVKFLNWDVKVAVETPFRKRTFRKMYDPY